jgi:hypothetical protein
MLPFHERNTVNKLLITLQPLYPKTCIENVSVLHERIENVL